MDVLDLCYAPATELASLIRRRELSPIELVDAVLARIDRVNPELNALCLVAADEARAAAREAERAVTSGAELGPLHGIPFTIKDLSPTKGFRTTFGSKAFADHVPDEDGVTTERLRAAGGIFLGKTATPEFGNKGLCDSPLLGETRNPWKTTHVSGGSSGGAAAAVAAGLGPLAEGGDAAGSIRIPASCCGVVGLKPSLGRVPVHPSFFALEPIVALGPITRTVADAALMLSVLAGPHPRDLFSLETSGVDYTEATRDPDVRGWRIAYTRDFGYNPVSPEVTALTDAAAQAFVGLGALVEEVDPGLPDPREAEITVWRAIFGLCANDFVRPALDSLDEMDPHLRELMEKGESISAWDFYRQAVFLRHEFQQKMLALFDRYDVLLSPTLAVPPFPQLGGAAGPSEIEGERVEPFGGWLLTYPFNWTGQPAISVPCGFSSEGLPIGLQVAGRLRADSDVLRAAAAYEQAAPWADRRPDLD